MSAKQYKAYVTKYAGTLGLNKVQIIIIAKRLYLNQTKPTIQAIKDVIEFNGMNVKI